MILNVNLTWTDDNSEYHENILYRDLVKHEYNDWHEIANIINEYQGSILKN